MQWFCTSGKPSCETELLRARKHLVVFLFHIFKWIVKKWSSSQLYHCCVRSLDLVSLRIVFCTFKVCLFCSFLLKRELSKATAFQHL